MLVLTRRLQEKVKITFVDDNGKVHVLYVSVLDATVGRAKLGFEAAKEFVVARLELLPEEERTEPVS